MFLKERYQNYKLPLKNYSLIQVSGVDSETFLHGQLTSDVKSLNDGEFHLTARLNRTGQVQTFGYLLKESSDLFYFLIETSIRSNLYEDLNKYIIMEEVELANVDFYFEVNWVVDNFNEGFKGVFAGEYAQVLIDKTLNLRELSEDKYQKIRKFNGYQEFDEIQYSKLVNDTFLEEYAVSYSKGCFLGQETAAKIHNNRGAAYFPTLLEVDKKIKTNAIIQFNGQKFGEVLDCIEMNGMNYLIVNLKRDYRIKNKNYELTLENNKLQAKVVYFPLFNDVTLSEKGVELYYEAVEQFKNDNEEEAKALLNQVIKMIPDFADAYESLGVILGRHGQYEEAIRLMDQLLEVNEDSVMAHTNKSLYLMKLGKIEEAEEEKGLATVKSFQQFGKEASQKKAQEELKEKEKAELEKKEAMFKQVLEIDPDDTIANFGMGEISFKRSLYDDSIAFLSKVLNQDDKYSRAYLLLGKSYEFTGKKDKAKEIYSKGIEVASKKGEMMPANEMQERIVNL